MQIANSDACLGYILLIKKQNFSKYKTNTKRDRANYIIIETGHVYTTALCEFLAENE